MKKDQNLKAKQCPNYLNAQMNPANDFYCATREMAWAQKKVEVVDIIYPHHAKKLAND